jgi:hypothetical protein
MMLKVRHPRRYIPLEDYELEAWDDYAVAPRRTLTDREVDTLLFAGAVGVVAAGLVIGFWVMRRR